MIPPNNDILFTPMLLPPLPCFLWLPWIRTSTLELVDHRCLQRSSISPVSRKELSLIVPSFLAAAPSLLRFSLFLPLQLPHLPFNLQPSHSLFISFPCLVRLLTACVHAPLPSKSAFKVGSRLSAHPYPVQAVAPPWIKQSNNSQPSSLL